jgi:hypothetical protein
MPAGLRQLWPQRRAGLPGRGYLTYQSASGFGAFQGIEVGIYLVLAALLGVTFSVITRWDG